MFDRGFLDTLPVARAGQHATLVSASEAFQECRYATDAANDEHGNRRIEENAHRGAQRQSHAGISADDISQRHRNQVSHDQETQTRLSADGFVLGRFLPKD